MQKKLKKTVSVLLTLVMLLSVFAGQKALPAAKAVAAGDLIRFGSYPQSKVTDTDLIAALEPAEKNWVSYRYYSGNAAGSYASNQAEVSPNDSPFDGEMQPGDWMQFADFFYGADKYRAVKIDELRPHATQQHTGTGYQAHSGFPVGTYYFKYEPLTWRVLYPSTGLVICEDVIDSQPYQNYVYMVGQFSTKTTDFRQGKTEPGFSHFATATPPAPYATG